MKKTYIQPESTIVKLEGAAPLMIFSNGNNVNLLEPEESETLTNDDVI